MTTLTITGNLTADPELKFTPQGVAVASFTLVSSKSSKNEITGQWENKDVTFWNIKCWKKLAENVSESLRKGMSVVVVGTAVQENWDDKATGAKRSKIAVTAWNVGVDLKRHTASVSVIERLDANQMSDVLDPWSQPLSDIAPF
jgi:single-strand DNA-binding protein